MLEQATVDHLRMKALREACLLGTERLDAPFITMARRPASTTGDHCTGDGKVSWEAQGCG